MMRSMVRVALLQAVIALAAAPLAGQNAPPGNPDDAGAREFVAAARRGDENAVRKALEKDPDLARATDALGMTALDWAATREHWHIFRQLLAKGAPVTQVGADGGTIMHRVCHHDRPDIVQALLDAGADLTVRNQWGRTPLHVAARRGCRRVAELLLARGANPDVGTKEGWTSLHVAYRAGQPEIVDLLLAAGADPDRRDSDGKVPADVAFTRPAEVPMEKARLYEYQGLYDLDGGFHFKVWVEDGGLMLRDFGDDALYPTGPDAFYCRSEPWSVAFRRDEGGAVSGIEVTFLRRAVRGARRDHPQYVGSDACRDCHVGREQGNQYVRWLSSRHAAAHWRLATDWAMFLARLRPHFRDMENPREDDRCLVCHGTGTQDEDALFASTFRETEGIGCEACHGPGSRYLGAEVMADREAFLAAGGVVPDERTCRSCHRNPEQFAFREWWPKIAHKKPEPSDPH